MKPLEIAAAKRMYLLKHEGLLQAFPELSEDQATLHDTLDGITDAADFVAMFVRRALEDEMLAEALAGRIKQMGERKSRFEIRALRHRKAALDLMESIGRDKVQMEDFTASIRAVPPSVIITDETALPDSLCETVRKPVRNRIKFALSQGPVAGATLSNGGTSLTIRTK